MKLVINDHAYFSNSQTSLGSPVYQKVPNKDVIAYFKELAAIEELPPPLLVPNKKDIYGNKGKLWLVQPKEGVLRGSCLILKTYSSSGRLTKAKLIIEIINKKPSLTGIRDGKIEIKFEDY